MKVIFFGSGQFAVPSLQRLVESQLSVLQVVTQPDRRAGRGGGMRPTPVKAFALEAGLPVEQPDDIGSAETERQIRLDEADICLVAAYGQKLPVAYLDRPPSGFLNAHAAILPKYRGAAPVPHAILNGETETGVTVFRIEEDWDTGPVYACRKTPISGTDTAETVLARLSLMAADLFGEVTRGISTGCLVPIPQLHAEASRAPLLRRVDGMIDWAESPVQIDCMVRAFQPWPVAYTFLPGRKEGSSLRLSILSVEESGVEAEGGLVPGTVIRADTDAGLVVSSGQGSAVALTTVKPEGKRAMPAVEFLRGYRMKGDVVLPSPTLLR